MIRHSTDQGLIAVDTAVYTNIAGRAASSCFGVRGMAARSVTDGLVHLLRKEAMGKGVKVNFFDDGSIAIDMHIIVNRGVNIAAIGEAITSEVKYHVEKSTGTVVRTVNVYVDSICSD